MPDGSRVDDGILARFRPKLAECLRGYSIRKFSRDLMAGISVGIVALSLCIGLGIASGVSPAAGLYAGIIGGFLVSALGGSRVQIGGPAGAFVGLLAVLGAKVGFQNLLFCTMLAGVFLIAMGLFKIGSLIRFVPQPVTSGFTCGIAITIFLTQVRAFFGLAMLEEPAEFFAKVGALWRAAGSVSVGTTVLSVVCILIVWKWPKRWSKRVPGSIVAVAVGTIVTGVFGANLETIGTVFGGIPQGLPKFAFPNFDWGNLSLLISPAFTIAILCAIESLLSAVVADGLIDDRHDSNQELMAQGLANVVTPLFGGIPVTGVLARTATNVRSGAVTPVSGMVHSVFLLAVLLVVAPLAKHIPLCSLSAVLMVVALRMGEWDEFRRLRRKPLGDAAVFVLTFLLTVCLDLTVAVGWGMLLAAGLFIKRVTDSTKVQAMSGDEGHEGGHGEKVVLPEGVVIYRVFGALLFGAADKLDAAFRRGAVNIRVVILEMSAVTVMDATALDRLENLHEKLRMHRRHLVLCGAHTQAFLLMKRAGFFEKIGKANVCRDLVEARARAEILLTEEHALRENLRMHLPPKLEGIRGRMLEKVRSGISRLRKRRG